MLELKNICFEVYDESIGNKKQILKDINLTIDDNVFLVLTGPNGCR